MPVTSSYVRPDSLTVEITGEHRAVVVAEFDDGRVFERHRRAPDSTAWAERLASFTGEIEAAVAESDAREAAESDVEITANYKQATQKQQAVAYIRRAIDEPDLLIAYYKLDKFNNYRLAQGWNLNQVQTNLAEAGLTAEEWDTARAFYQYMTAQRVSTLESAQVVIDGDPR